MPRPATILLTGLTACAIDEDAPKPADSGTVCPGMACPDELTLSVISPDGNASTRFAGWARLTDGTETNFSCGSEVESFDDGRCLGDGRVALYLYGETIELWVDEGDDAPWFSGTISPAWDAPWDSDECGHYCYIAAESVTLLPCENCG